MKSKADKVAQLAQIKEIMGAAKSVVLVDFCGLTVAEDTELRTEMRKAGVHYSVYKNTLISIAAKEAGVEGLDAVLEHNTAIATSSEDAVAPCKVVCDFAKKHDKMQVKAGILDGKMVSAEEVKAIAALPPKEVLVAKMLGSMNSPITGFVNVLQGTIRNVVYALDAVRQAKESA